MEKTQSTASESHPFPTPKSHPEPEGQLPDEELTPCGFPLKEMPLLCCYRFQIKARAGEAIQCGKTVDGVHWQDEGKPIVLDRNYRQSTCWLGCK